MAGQTDIPADVADSIDAILGYLWDDEQDDYEAEGEPEGHVFEHALRVSTWLDEQRKETQA